MADLGALKRLVDQLKKDPASIHKPELKFFKDYLTSLGAKLPVSDDDLDAEVDEAMAEDPASHGHSHAHGDGHGHSHSHGHGHAHGHGAAPPPEAGPAAREPEPAEEPEEKDPDVIAVPDVVDPAEHAMGDLTREITDDEADRAQEAKSQAQDALDAGNFAEAVKRFTEALQLNPGMAMLYASRGNAFLKLRRPNACVLDCDAAVKINPNSAKAYKIRGRAHALLGHWDQSLSDLQRANALDYDPETYEEAKRVKAKAEAAQAREKARKQRAQARASAGSASGAYDFSKLPKTLTPEIMQKLTTNPRVMQLMQNPKIAQAFALAVKDPSKIPEASKDPEVAEAIQIFLDALK